MADTVEEIVTAVQVVEVVTAGPQGPPGDATAAVIVHSAAADPHGDRAAAATDATTKANAAQAASLQKASNLADLASAPTARTNLGLGTAATTAAGAYDPAGSAATAQAAAVATSAQRAGNLADLTSASTARTNLGLGTAATQPSTAFDAAGLAAGAQTAATAAAAADATAKVATEAAARATADGLLETQAHASGTYRTAFKVQNYGTVDTTGATDSSTAVLAAIAACAAVGGIVEFPAGTIRVDSQIVIPNDGAASYPRQASITLAGAGSYSNPIGGSGPYPSLTGAKGTFLDLRYSGGGSNLSKIVTLGTGMLKFRDLTLCDLGTSSNPFLLTTSTTLNVAQVAFIGNPSKSGVTCDQDAIILGGVGPAFGGLAVTDAFQGYGTVIKECYFGRIRRAVLGQAFCNGVVIRDNNVWISCGSNLAAGAAIEVASPGPSSCFGNVISGNLIEVGFYPYGISLEYAQGHSLIANNFYDQGGVTLAYIRMASTNAKLNLVVAGYGSTTKPMVSEATVGINVVIDSNDQAVSQYVNSVMFNRGLKTGVLNNVGAGNPEITLNSLGTIPPGVYVIASGVPAFAANPGSLCLVKSAAVGKALWIKQYGTGTSGWGGVEPSAPRYVLVQTGNRTLGDDDYVIFNGGASTVTLPTAVGLTGRLYTVKNVNAAALTVATTSSQTVDGAAPATLTQWQARTFMSDGANWLTV